MRFLQEKGNTGNSAFMTVRETFSAVLKVFYLTVQGAPQSSQQQNLSMKWLLSRKPRWRKGWL
jgi:hypothetical protein